MCKIHQNSFGWSHLYVSITCDAGGGNSWWLHNDNLGTGLPAIEEYRELPVGDAMLRLYVIEVSGDGMMGRGDSIVVKSVNSSQFRPNATYEFMLWLGGLIHISGTEYKMNFWFEEGELETGPMEITHSFV